MDVLRLSWDDFDQAVDVIAAACAGQGLEGVHGVARGGLPLAVALSHRLDLPLFLTPSFNVLNLDDIHDTGRTVRDLRTGRPSAWPIWVWVTRQAEPKGYHAVLTDIGPQYVVFPWEDPNRAQADRTDYYRRRGLK